MGKIAIKFDADAVLPLLSSSLYDTPLAALRENLQNAFDAVLMRRHEDPAYTDPMISLTVDGSRIEVRDTGIGMTAKEVEENFWTAGKSGKNNDSARAAGVVGRFGIGALSNFGVCDSLELVTRKVGSALKCFSSAHRKSLNDIDIHEEPANPEDCGTTIAITTAPGHEISADSALEYIRPFAKYVGVPVFFNGTLISGQTYPGDMDLSDMTAYQKRVGGLDYIFTYRCVAARSGHFRGRIYIKDICVSGQEYHGDVYLDTEERCIWGLWNGFGLTVLPLNTNYKFGGVVNLDILQPTAGREAVSRICMTKVQQLVDVIEDLYTDIVALDPLCDLYPEFIQYVDGHFSFARASNVKIKVNAEGDEQVPLGSLLDEKGRVKYFRGSDTTILRDYASFDGRIVVVSRDNPRRSVQTKFLAGNGFEMIDDRVKVMKVYSYEELEIEHVAIVTGISGIIKKDYLILDNEVKFADISHNVNIFVENDKAGKLWIYIRKGGSEIPILTDVYNNNTALFNDFLVDFVRNNIYPSISRFIPTSRKYGAAAFVNMLKKRNEAFSIESYETETIGQSLGLLKDGKITADEFVQKINKTANTSRQSVRPDNVADLMTVVHNANPVAVMRPKPSADDLLNTPLPPITRQDSRTAAKLLTTDISSNILHGYKKFISFTDKMYRENLPFFIAPHTTRVIWSMHRIIYIFTLGGSGFTIYYDIGLQKHLDNNLTGGKPLVATTILTKDKIFVPIPHELENYFSFTAEDKPLNFTIHYDSIEGD